jgi:hypothetical protein
LDITLIQELGLPLAGTIGLAWLVLKFINWGKDYLLKEIEELRGDIVRLEKIIVQLIDNEKKNEITLKEISSNLDTIIKVIK